MVALATVPLAGVGDITGNLSGACSKPTGASACISPQDMNLNALQIVGGLSQEVPTDPAHALWLQVVKFAPVWRFTESFGSGVLMGAVGLAISPVVSLVNSFKAFGADLKAKQFLSAVYDIVNIPANMTNAFFNGAGFLDLSKVVEKFAEVSLGAIGKLGLNLGGLLMGQYLGEKLRVTLPQAATGAAVKAAAVKPAAAAVEAPAAEVAAEAPAVAEESAAESAPASSAPTHRKAARAAAASSGGTDRAGGHARSARSSR